MLGLVTGFSVRSVEGKDGRPGRTYASVSFVKGRRAEGQGNFGCEVVRCDLEPDLASKLTGQTVPGIFDIDLDVRQFGQQSQLKVVGLEYAGSLSQYSFSASGLVRREAPASARGAAVSA